MSILDENYSDCTENIVEAALSRPKNPLHIDISDEDYEKVREIYYPIRNLYQTFFRKHCFYNTLEEINKSVTSELTRVILGFDFVSPRLGGIIGKNPLKNNPSQNAWDNIWR